MIKAKADSGEYTITHPSQAKRENMVAFLLHPPVLSQNCLLPIATPHNRTLQLFPLLQLSAFFSKTGLWVHSCCEMSSDQIGRIEALEDPSFDIASEKRGSSNVERRLEGSPAVETAISIRSGFRISWLKVPKTVVSSTVQDSFFTCRNWSVAMDH